MTMMTTIKMIYTPTTSMTTMIIVLMVLWYTPMQRRYVLASAAKLLALAQMDKQMHSSISPSTANSSADYKSLTSNQISSEETWQFLLIWLSERERERERERDRQTDRDRDRDRETARQRERGRRETAFRHVFWSRILVTDPPTAWKVGAIIMLWVEAQMSYSFLLQAVSVHWKFWFKLGLTLQWCACFRRWGLWSAAISRDPRNESTCLLRCGHRGGSEHVQSDAWKSLILIGWKPEVVFRSILV